MAIVIDQVVTKGGDKGRTSLGSGRRVPKSHVLIEMLGALDEANAVIGVLVAHLEHAPSPGWQEESKPRQQDNPPKILAQNAQAQRILAQKTPTKPLTLTKPLQERQQGAGPLENTAKQLMPGQSDLHQDGHASGDENLLRDDNLVEWLLKIQSTLFDMGAEISLLSPQESQKSQKGSQKNALQNNTSQNNTFQKNVSQNNTPIIHKEEKVGSSRLKPEILAEMEQKIAACLTTQQPLKTFILPGGTLPAAYAHQARTVIRRAERQAVSLAQKKYSTVNPLLLELLNRLSDYFFVLARRLNHHGQADRLWKP
ncbi:ATP:cob(I)alamin adenosyltransferase [Entomobacter blattae]|uniref:Corrinoid adenosyltransferase n=1 Tax=Entomobacter blattae TaxID=2762277 RepID=A0A7H1NRE2_9PROT|nr:ATP:cob(I)alamin adenosyltransferase [Entomobacter blattae]QNT78352.1 Cobalamin adenosyltransferase [Entomobacter blattae]